MRSIDEAFSELLSRLTPSGTETQLAASHRASIEDCLKANFSLSRFFRSGSFGYGTSVSGYSDVDYFAVMPATILHQNSSESLNAIARALRMRFPRTNVYVDAPAVIVPFGEAASEKHEIIPAYQIGQSSGAWINYGIPNRSGGWLQSSPELSGAMIDLQHTRLSQKAKPVIRLIKAWKYFCRVPIRSFYLEMKVAEYLATQSIVMYKIDVSAALNYLHLSGLADMSDPAGGTTPIYACFSHEHQNAMDWLAYAKVVAASALDQEKQGNLAQAFEQWNKLFNNQFPGRY